MALLELRDLRTFFRSKRGTVKAVNGVSYSVDAGKVASSASPDRARACRP